MTVGLSASPEQQAKPYFRSSASLVGRTVAI